MGEVIGIGAEGGGGDRPPSLFIWGTRFLQYTLILPLQSEHFYPWEVGMGHQGHS